MVEIRCSITQSTVTTEATRSFEFVYVMFSVSDFVCIFDFRSCVFVLRFVCFVCVILSYVICMCGVRVLIVCFWFP